MLELATLGAQVLHNRVGGDGQSAMMSIWKSSPAFSGNPGHESQGGSQRLWKNSHVVGVAKDTNIARLALVGLSDKPGTAFRIFSLLAKNKINVDIILQSIGRNDTKDISFTVAKSDLAAAEEVLEKYKASIGFDSVQVSDQIAKISIVGAGMINNPGVASDMFGALYNADININMISTSEIKVSVLVDIKDADRAVQVVHDKFFKEFGE